MQENKVYLMVLETGYQLTTIFKTTLQHCVCVSTVYAGVCVHMYRIAFARACTVARACTELCVCACAYVCVHVCVRAQASVLARECVWFCMRVCMMHAGQVYDSV